MIVYRTNVSTSIILTANHGVFYIANDFGGGLFGTNRGLVFVAN